jgi:hypothetical protein
VGGSFEQRLAVVRRVIGVDHHRNAAGHRSTADRDDKIRETIIDQNSIDGANKPIGMFYERFVKPMIPKGRNGAIASIVHKNCRHRCACTANAYAADAFHAVTLQAVNELISDHIIASRPAERPCKIGLAAEPCYRKRGVGGTAARNGDKLARPDFGIRHWKRADAKNFVDSGNAGAKNIRHLRKGSGRPRAMPV